MHEKRAPIGRAYIHDGWRTIYGPARAVRRGKHKGSLEVCYIDLRDGKSTYVKIKVREYRTLEGAQKDAREESYDAPHDIS